MHRFIAYGKVKGSSRPRFARGRAYMPKSTRDYVRLIRAACIDSGCPMMHGPVKLKVDVFRALPASAPKRVIGEPDTLKPDADNVAKAVMDALSGVAYADDAQVCELIVKKHDRRRITERIEVSVGIIESSDQEEGGEVGSE